MSDDKSTKCVRIFKRLKDAENIQICFIRYSAKQGGDCLYAFSFHCFNELISNGRKQQQGCVKFVECSIDRCAAR